MVCPYGPACDVVACALHSVLRWITTCSNLIITPALPHHRTFSGQANLWPMKPLNESEVNIVKAMVAAVSKEPPAPALDQPSGQSWFDKHEAILRHSLEAAGGRIVRGGLDVAL